MTPSAVTLSLVMAGVALIAISTSAISIGATIHVQRQLAYGQLLDLDRYIEQLPPEQQLPYSNPQIARHIQEVDIPVYDQPPSTDFNINTPDRVNTTNVQAIDFQVNQTYGSPFLIDAQYQNGSINLDAKTIYFN